MPKSNTRYANFLVRFFAVLIDSFIFILLLKVLTVFIKEGSPYFLILFVIIWWLYVTLLLSSSWSATVGQKILGLKVITINDEKLTFKQASLRVIYAFFLAPFILPLMMYFFSDKRQTLHDYLSKSVVVDRWYGVSAKEEGVVEIVTNRKKRIFRTIIVTIGFLTVLIFVGYIVAYSSVMYVLYSSRDTAYNNSFYQTYHTNDYNDSRIQFYDGELHRYSKNFIVADKLYTIFEADVKRDLALGCIQYFVRRYDNDIWIDMGSGFRQNARNSYANTEKKIEKSKENEHFMGDNFYVYDTNMVNDIENDITKLWSDSNLSVCEDEMPVEVMYEPFILEYMDRFIAQNINGHYAPSKNESEWYQTLQLQFPEYFENIKRREAILKKEIKTKELKAIEEDKKRKKILFNQAIEEKKNPLLAAVWFEQNTVVEHMIYAHSDLNIKDRFGRTPIFIAVQVGNSYALEKLLENGAGMYIMDVNGLYTAFTEMLSHPHVDINMVKLFLDNGYDVNFQYKKGETALSIAVKGCDKIALVKLLLKNGANSKIMDRYQSNTILKVQRGCQKSEFYDELIELLD